MVHSTAGRGSRSVVSSIWKGSQICRGENARRGDDAGSGGPFLAKLECGGILSAQYVLRAIQRRWRLVVGIFLLTCVAVGIFVFGRKHHTAPVRYRSTVTVRVGAKQPAPDLSNAQVRRLASTSTTAPLNIAQVGPTKFALRKGVRDNALRLSHLRPNARIGFSARLDSTQTIMSLVATAPTRPQAQTVARNWAKTFKRSRVADAKRKIIRAQNQLGVRVRRLHDELRRVDAILVKIMPIVYHGILRFDAPNGNLPGRGKNGTAGGPPPVP